MTPSQIISILFSVSIYFTDATEVASSGSGKAIYTSSSRNPISTYFKEHKNKLRPYFTRPASTDSDSDLIPASFSTAALSLHDENSASVGSSNLYSHSNYYDSGGAQDSNIYQSGSSTTAHNDDQHGSSNFMDLYDSSNPEYQASNVIYSVADPLSNGYGIPGRVPPISSSTNPGYYGGDPVHGPYSQPPSYHGPGLPHSSNSAGGGGGNAGYYGTGDAMTHAHPQPASNYHENSVYTNPTSNGAAPPGNGNTPFFHSSGGNGSPGQSATHHHGSHAPTSNTHNNHINHDKNNVASDNSEIVFPIPGGAGYGANDEEENGYGADNGYGYDYGTTPEDDDMLMESFPLFGGGGGGDTTTPAPSTASDPSTTDNPLNFLNLVGTDFQPGRLVNIFFGLFIMLFMIIVHGYALWILGIAYLPGTRALNQWELDKDKLEGICSLVLDALEYWENKID